MSTGLAQSTRKLLFEVSTATLTTQLIKHGYRNTFFAGLFALRPDLRMVGTATTLRYVPAREDMDMGVDFDNDHNVQRLAVEAIEQGQVLVIDARQDTRAASLGHILATRMMRRGAAGLVTDGALRDTPSFGALQLPVYCRGAHAVTSSTVHHPVERDVPIGCAGVLVMPGDVMVGDAEGVVVIPSAVCDDVAQAAYEQERLEEFITQKVDQGASIRGVYPPDEDVLSEYRRR